MVGASGSLNFPIGEFEDLVSDYLRAKGFSNAEMVIRVKGEE